MDFESKMQELLRRKSEFIFDHQTIELCFELIEHHPNIIEQCRAAVILSGIVQKGLGAQTQEFLKTHSQLHPRVREILNNSILRMEGF